MQLRLPSTTTRTWYLVLIGLLLVLGCFLRLAHLGHYPTAANHDELSNIYDGYCIAETGADRWGEQWPLMLRGFGREDYRPPMYAWLSAVPIKLFGFSLVTGRIISALAGCASLVLLYSVGRRMGGRGFAALALLLAVLSPWHLVFSRIASEGTMLPPFFLIAACYLWQRAYDKHYSYGSLLLLGLCVGLGTNTYQASKLLFLLVAIWVVIDLRRADRFLAKAAALGLGCLIGAAPQLLLALTEPAHFFSRADGSLMAFSWSFQYLNDLLNHLSLHLAPEFLFFSFGSYNNLSMGQLLLLEVAVFYVGLIMLGRVVSREQAIKPVYFYLLLLAAILPSALTRDSPHALRASGLTVLLPLVSAAGLCVLYRAISRPQLRRLVVAASVGLIFWNGLYYVKAYTGSEKMPDYGMQALMAASSKKLPQYKDHYDAVLIEDFGNQSYICVAALGGMKPAEFQRADKQYDDSWVWDRFQKLDKFYFLAAGEIPAKLQALPGRKLLLQRQANPAYQEIDRVYAAGDTAYFYEVPGQR